MDYKENELKQGIKFHTINTNKFKTNLMAIILTTKLEKENITKNALISLLLRRGSKDMQTQEEISKQMEELYGAAFNIGLEKIGDNQAIKIFIETINDKYLPQTGESMLKEALEKLLEITFNPYTEKEGFSKKYLDQEKNTVKKIINARTDNKARYAKERCLEEMYKDTPYGLFEYGDIEDLENINETNLYEYYKQLIQNCKIDIFLSGELQGNEIEILKQNENIQKLEPRNPIYAKPTLEGSTVKNNGKIVIESLNVSQGKLVIGLDVEVENEDEKYDVVLYNTILGGSASSKLFQNVREKAHLAYVASSNYFRIKNNILINCGIEISNFEKALKIAKEQVEDMKNGKFTKEEIENSKKVIESTINSIENEQDTQITYCFSQEMQENKMTLEKYKERILKVTKEDILKIANKVSINTIYFLKNND